MDLKEQIALLRVLGEDPELLEHPLLRDRDKEIFKARWGLIDGKKRSLAEVGKLHGVTRERIRQIEAKVIEIVRQVCKDLDIKING